MMAYGDREVLKWPGSGKIRERQRRVERRGADNEKGGVGLRERVRERQMLG